MAELTRWLKGNMSAIAIALVLGIGGFFLSRFISEMDDKPSEDEVAIMITDSHYPILARIAQNEKDVLYIKTVTIAADGTKLHLTGSDAGSSGFIVKTAGQGVITPTEGDAVSTGDFTTKTLYEIGVKEISGACTVHVVY